MGRKLVATLITAALVSPSFVSAKPPPKFNKPPPEHIQKVGGPKDRKVPKELLKVRGTEGEEKSERRTRETERGITEEEKIERGKVIAELLHALVCTGKPDFEEVNFLYEKVAHLKEVLKEAFHGHGIRKKRFPITDMPSGDELMVLKEYIECSFLYRSGECSDKDSFRHFIWTLDDISYEKRNFLKSEFKAALKDLSYYERLIIWAIFGEHSSFVELTAKCIEHY